MPRRFAVSLAIACLTALLSDGSTLTRAATTQSGQHFDFYISPNGNDSWSGRLAEPNATRSDGPFATTGKEYPIQHHDEK